MPKLKKQVHYLPRTEMVHVMRWTACGKGVTPTMHTTADLSKVTCPECTFNAAPIRAEV